MTLTGIALLPRDDLRARLVEFRARHQESIAGPELGLDVNLPHMSILQCPFSGSLDRQHVVDAVAEQVRRFSTPLRFEGLSYKPRAWVFADLEKPQWLVDIQGTALSLSREHIDLASLADRAVDELTPAEFDSYRTYGYRYVGKAFRPHITLGRTPNRTESLEPGLSEAFWSGFSESDVTFSSVVFYEAGESGVLARGLAQSEI